MAKQIPKKRERGANYTPEEKTMLAELIMQYKHIIEDKRNDGIHIRKKKEAWTIVTNKYNSRATTGHRGTDQLKVLYDNLKQKTRKNIGESNIQMKNRCADHDSRILAIIQQQVKPLSNPYDSAADYFKDEEDNTQAVDVKIEIDAHPIAQDNTIEYKSMFGDSFATGEQASNVAEKGNDRKDVNTPPTQPRPRKIKDKKGVGYPHWEAARRAVANAGVDNELEFLRRLYSSRLVLRDAADELLCARCGQWSFTAAELHQHQTAHSTEHPRDCLQPNACATPLVGFQAQPTAFTEQRENTSPPATLTHKLFICDLGQKHFTTKSVLAKYIHSHTKTDSGQQRGTTFKLKDNLKKREVVPSPINALSYDVCSKRYSTKSSLNRHKQIHTGTRAFACDKCSKSSTRKSTLSRHILIHNGFTAFSCHKCSKSFSQKSHLSQHMLIHNEYKPFAYVLSAVKVIP